MTRIGQMIFNDGYAKGFEEGLAEADRPCFETGTKWRAG